MFPFFRKTILLIPHPSLSGGVSNYYKVAKKYFSSDIKYVIFNSKHTGGILKPIINILIILKVLAIISISFPKRVVVNPSLGKTALLRDGFFVLWTHLFLKKTIVFWRGWNPKNESVLDGKVIKTLFNLSYLKSSKHLVLNQYIKTKLIALGIKKDKIYFTNTIVDDSIINYKSSSSKEENFIVLFLTRVERYKGIYETLQIFEALNAKSLNIEVHIAGNGSELNKIKEIVSLKKYSNIKFLGYLDGEEKMKAFKNADVYLFPSYSEGMPNSVIEAMGSSLPVVCTNVGALGDFFIDGKMGYIHSLPIEINSIESSILKIYSDKELQKKMANFNHEYAKEHFIASKSIQKLEELINQ